MLLLGSGATWRTKSTVLAHDVAFTCHPWVRAVRFHPSARCPVEACDKGLSSVPHQEAHPVHGGVGKAPEWVRFIRQKVGCSQGFFGRSDGLAAERAVSLPRSDPIHDSKLAPYASRCLTDRASTAATGRLGQYPTFLRIEGSAAACPC